MSRWRYLRRREAEPGSDEPAASAPDLRVRTDPAAFDALCAEMRDPVIRACYYRLGDWDAAEDAAQETMLRAFARMERFDPRGEGSFRAWVIRIAHNEAIDEVRRRTRRPETPIPESPSWQDPAPSPEQLAIDRDAHARLLTLLARLSDKQRRIMELVFAGLGYREIAALTGEKEPNVRQIKGRALDTLQAWMEDGHA